MNDTEKQILSKINIAGGRDGYKFRGMADVDTDERGVLFYALSFNRGRHFDFGEEEFDYLIRNNDLKRIDNKTKMSVLMTYIFYSNEEQIKLWPETGDYLLKNSDLKHLDFGGNDAQNYLLLYNKNHPLTWRREWPYPLNEKQIEYLIDNSPDHKKIFYGVKWTCPILLAITNKHDDFLITKMIGRRLKTDKEYFNKKYFDGIQDEAIKDKLNYFLDIAIVREKIDEKLQKNGDVLIKAANKI